MPLGAHETMEVHEILMEKINMITHFNLYAQQARNPQLLDMIVRHQQEEILGYNALVAVTGGSTAFNPIPPNTDVRGITNQQIHYGLNNPPQFAPQPDAAFSDVEILMAMLLCHKNAARNSAWASLECADPNVRRTLLNSSANCNNQAYEVFLFMNELGLYQVPTLNSRVVQEFLNSYQPAGAPLQAQYGVQSAQNAGYMGQSSYGADSYSTNNMVGPSAPGGSTMSNWSTGSRESVLYGDGRGAAPMQTQTGNASTYGNMNSRGGQMPQ